MNATQLEKFCREYHIRWSYETKWPDGTKFEFYHLPSDREYIVRIGLTERLDTMSLIWELICAFPLELKGGEKEVEYCNVDSLRELATHIKTYCGQGGHIEVGTIVHQTLGYHINKVIFNDPATIVIWADGTKTVVKADREKFDPEKGLAMAIAKKFLGNQGNYYEVFKKWLPEEKDEESLYPNIEIPKINVNVKDLRKQLTGIKNRLRNLTTDGIPTYLTAAELAEKLGLSVETVRRDCRDGFHPGAVKISGKWMIPYEE